MSYLRNGALVMLGLAAGASLTFTGCGTQESAESSSGGTQTAGGAAIPENMSGIAELSGADQSAALEQKVCPVSEKPLGSMGKPPKVTVEGQDVFLCCGGCTDAVKEEPEKYLAKLEGK